MHRLPSNLFTAASLLAGLLCFAACATHGPETHAAFARRPAPPQTLAGVAISGEDYRQILHLGADWFRYETFGGERAITDLIGFLQATVEVPCSQPPSGACFRHESTLPYFARALDDLDGVRGNLYVGNGGPAGAGYTHDLTLRFPPGSRLHDLPLPAEVHTGLDVEAGSAWPIGVVPVPANDEDAKLPYVWNLAALGAGKVDGPEHVRVGITCALCHYSLDVDWDGVTDLKSALLDHPTPGSPYRPEQAWAVGNQDLKVGWLFALSQNPLVGLTVLSGPIGVGQNAEAAFDWARWVGDNYRSAPVSVTREVVRGMLLQPRGYADVSANARYDASQFPPLFTQGYWPSNSDGSILNPADRDNVAWTGTMDFSGLVALSKDRGGKTQLYWEPKSVYDAFTARQLAELMVYESPAALFDTRQGERLRDDILGTSDGVPGLLDPASMFVMQGPPNAVPSAVFDHPENVEHDRRRTPAEFGGDAPRRGALMALLGLRVHTRPKVAASPAVQALLARYPTVRADELTAEAVNAVLDWEPSPPNLGRRAARASGLLQRGAQVFERAGCGRCHAGAFFTDNLVHRLSARRAEEVGIAAASTAAWRSLGRGQGPAIGTDAEHAVSSRPLVLFLDPSYDPASGKTTGAGSPLRGLFGGASVGYKTSQLRYLWGSAPYLHDGGVGVAIAPESGVDRDDLKQVLGLPPAQKVYGMGRILAVEERQPGRRLRADAALSLQALLLQSERAQVLARQDDRVIPVPGLPCSENPLGAPAAVSAAQLGVVGKGHEFFIDDVPGGEEITPLIACLLSLDDDPLDATNPTTRPETSH